MRFFIGFIVIVIIGLGAWYLADPGFFVSHDALPVAEEIVEYQSSTNASKNTAQETLPRYTSSFSTDFSQHSVPLDEILSGGPGKDDIPALTNPAFTTTVRAKTRDDVLGILVSIGETKRWYGYDVLTWHGVVNDTINDTDIAVTFCPLCGSAIVFDRKVGDTTLEFGVSGLLYESNLVMYDKQTESLWSQTQNRSIVGAYTNTKLSLIPMQVISFGELAEKHPETEVLSRETGYERVYGYDPYSSYVSNNDLFFADISFTDERLPAKELMVVIPYQGTSYTLPLASLDSDSRLVVGPNDIFTLVTNGEALTVLANGERIPYYIEMWFSWAIHHQDDGVLLENTSL